MTINKNSDWVDFAFIIAIMVIPCILFGPSNDSDRYTYQSSAVLEVGDCTGGFCASRVLTENGTSLFATIDGPIMRNQSVYLWCKKDTCRKTWSTRKPVGS